MRNYLGQPWDTSPIDEEAEQLESWRAWAETKISDPTGSMRAIVQITTWGGSPPHRDSASVKQRVGLKIQYSVVRSPLVNLFAAV